MTDELNPIVVTEQLLKAFAVPFAATQLGQAFARDCAKTISDDIDRQVLELLKQEK